MSVGASGSSPVPLSDAETLILRIEESFYSMQQFGGANTPARQLITGKFIDTQGGDPPSMLGNQVIPAGATMPLVAGRAVCNIVSGAAALTRLDNTLTALAFPVEQLFNDAAAPTLNRPARSYLFQVPCRITVVGTAIIEIGIVTSANMLTFAGTPPGAIWSSNPAVNAGRWLPRYRQVNAGAITDGADSGVTTVGWHLLGMRYVEGGTPRIEWLLDGAVRRTVSSDANMPTFPGGINYPGFVVAYGVSIPAGTTVQFGQALAEVRNV